MESSDRLQAQPCGGRGARERILWAAAKLFYEEGINATGMNRLTEVAHVSKRTFYQHFSSKSALVEEYLRRFEGDGAPRCEQALSRTDLTPRERLLGVFAEAAGDGAVRGCPFHNAAVEAAGSLPGVQEVVTRHKQDFAQHLIGTAREAGADDPEGLGRQLAVLFEGAGALATSLGDDSPLRDARSAAATLIDVATRWTVGRR
ncbi:TetR/AcrR family transcriptional regulator [Streptomyces sp. NPDC058964]|uniref:TetR/AcrR family transcriptional regulator n=1 Tax=Streptomyces sp. NPDC058964 TaxID=3346681 RepID=UPI0036B166BD